MHKHRAAKRAFTLIEILIVVVILGILAAIVIPQFTSAADDAQLSSTQSQLQTVRSQIELWNIKNPADRFDGSNWDRLLNANDAGDGERYLQSEPRNALRNNVTGVTTDTSPGADDGWYWDADERVLYAFDADGDLVDW